MTAPVFTEDAWTKPRPDCPHPEWWMSTDPQSTEIQVSELVAGFVRALQPEYVVETGSCVGQTAHIIGLALQANGHGHLDTIEVNPDLVELTRRRCDGLPVTVVAGASLDFTPRQEIQFAWLDSRLELRVDELERFRPWLAPGAVVGVHDTAAHHGPLGDTLAGLPGVRSIQLPTPRGVTFLQVG